jgi:hypothetical protein
MMINLETNDPTQRPNLHNDTDTFDDPVRKAGPDATATFDNSVSNPTEWAGSEALVSTVPGEEDTEAGDEDFSTGRRADAADTGIDDADRDDSVVEDEEDVIDDDDDDDDEDDDDIDDDDEALVDEDGAKKIR